ncbi:acetyl-CoA carboxylase biotin carboxyl carrier protein [Bacillaceae bacterium]
MFKIQEIKELLKLIDQSSIQEFAWEHEGSRITIKKGSVDGQNGAPPAAVRPATQFAATVAPAPQTSAPAPSAPAEKGEEPRKQEQEEKLHPITSPMVGTFYRAPAPDADPYVKVGDRVQEDTVVCIVEAMKLMNEIEAEVKGTIVEVLAENGQLVEYGQPLFLVKVD